MNVASWGLTREGGELHMDGVALPALAEAHGTPLHVASAARLRLRAAELQRALAGHGPGVRVHFSYKTNMVAGVLQVLHGEGIHAEVVSPWELWLARRLGMDGERIVLNGPNKASETLEAAVEADVGLIVLDDLGEVARVERVAADRGVVARVGLRICPDVVPRGMNASSLTGSRRSQFGLDLGSGEVEEALRRVVASPHLRLRGAMAHIGSGIHDIAAFTRAIDRLLDVQAQAWAAGAEPDLLDLGGGLGTTCSREFTTFEMLAYLGTGRLPRGQRPAGPGLVARYGSAVCEAVDRGCRARGIALPELVVEPGRALVSDAQVLLLRVGTTRERPGTGRFALTDGGAMTVSMMFLSELHAVLLANREAPDEALVRTHVFGRLPSPMDVVYRNLPLPALRVGDLLAVMDAGAYFTSTSTNFGGPRPAVVLVDQGGARVVQRRETFEDLAARELVLEGPE